ncbi:MAG: hypothetical protein MI976_07970 [Pseudomonadales bacterium]|nr:hypothetical protein [Pseudomonadales bacterium]
MDLENRFCSLFQEEVKSETFECFRELETRYSEQHRHYHTMKHVEACLVHLDAADIRESKRTIELALWFHDAIYNPKKKDNELKSAELSSQWLLRLGEPPETIDTVVHYIKLTVHPSQPSTLNEKYLLDIDLSILGSSQQVYADYEAWVREEYSYVPSILYKAGRKKVLKSFLQQDSIYSTDSFKNRFERQARVNLKLAITQLGG